MPTIQEVTQDPEFKSWPKEKQLYMLGKADPEFGSYEPEKQNYYLDKFVKGDHKPDPIDPRTVSGISTEPEQKSFLGELTDKFAPTALLKNLSDIANYGIEQSKFWKHPENLIPGVPFYKAIVGPAVDKSVGNIKKGIEDISSANDLPSKLIAGGKAAIGAVPVLNESLGAGERMIPIDPSKPLNWSASGSMVGDLANAFLPKMTEAAGEAITPRLSSILRGSGERNIQNILNARTNTPEIPMVEDLSKKVMGGKYDVAATSDKNLMEKLGAQKSARLGPNKAIEDQLADIEVGPRGRETATGPIKEFIHKQGDNPNFANLERANAGVDAQQQLENLFSEPKTTTPNEPKLSFDDMGNPVQNGPVTTRVPKTPKFKDLLETKQSASEMARKHDYFDRPGPGFDEVKAAKGQAAGKVAKGTGQALEDIVNEHGQTTPMPDGFNVEKSPVKGSSTVSIKGPNGEKLALKELPDRIHMETIGKGKAVNSRQTVDAMRAYGQQTGKPVYINSTSLTADAGKFYENMLKRGEMVETPEGYLLKGTGDSAPNPDFLKYGKRNSEAADLINMESLVGRQKTLGTFQLPKYALSRIGSAFGGRVLGAEGVGRVAGSTAFNTGMAYSKKALADILAGRGLSHNVATILAGKLAAQGDENASEIR